MKTNIKRNKAFLGSVIGSVAGIAGGLIQSAAAKRQQRRQQIAENKRATYESANNLSAGYANQDYIDDFEKKVTFKNGGKTKRKSQYTDRINTAKKFKCGGRKKAEWGKEDTINAIESTGNLANAIIGATTDTTIKQGNTIATTAKDSIKVPDYVMNNEYRMRCGGKKRRK